MIVHMHISISETVSIASSSRFVTSYSPVTGQLSWQIIEGFERKIGFKLIVRRLDNSAAMSRKISGSGGVVIILVVLTFNVHSNPIDSGDIFQRVSKPDNFQQKPSFAGPFRRLFCLDESAIARLSEIADVLLATPNGRRDEVRKILIPEEPVTMEVRKEWKFSPKVVEKLEFKPRKFQCHPIEDVFIPAVEKKVPAYICKLHDRQFVISSERFLEDFKKHLEIDVDETTFRRLSVDDGTSMVNSVADVIPVTLTQRRGEEFYGVKKG